MKKNEDEYLRKIYFNPEFSASFTGPDKLFRFVKKDGKFQFSKKDIKKWIQSQEVYTTNRLVKHKIKRHKVIAPYIDYMWDADTASLVNYKEDNDGKGYFVLVIDIMSRYVWTQAVKTPSASEILKVFKTILKSNRKPELLRTDKGTEFVNKFANPFFKKQKIKHFVTQNEVKASYGERAIQTLKNKIFRYLRAKQTHRWVDKLPAFTEAYNNTYHSSIKRTPASVTKKDENELWQILYKPSKLPPTRKKDFKFNIGDLVRISKLKKAFQRMYSEHWTNEVFRIRERGIKQNIPFYELNDYLKDPIIGTFYEEELQQVFINKDTKFLVDEVLGKKTIRGKSYTEISWVGWPKKFNTWLPTSNIDDYI